MIDKIFRASFFYWFLLLIRLKNVAIVPNNSKKFRNSNNRIGTFWFLVFFSFSTKNDLELTNFVLFLLCGDELRLCMMYSQTHNKLHSSVYCVTGMDQFWTIVDRVKKAIIIYRHRYIQLNT